MIAVFAFIALFAMSSVSCTTPQKMIFQALENQSPKELFKAFVTVYEKGYSLDSEEAKQRYKIFKQNLKEIKEVNAKNLGYKYGINKFSDLTQEEFSSKFLLKTEVLQNKMKNFLDVQGEEVYGSPKVQKQTIDWTRNFPPVRDQGNCGSCWAFTTTAVAEASWSIANPNQKPFHLSPQQLVDCDKGNGGCNGGWYDDALNYGRDNGLMAEQDYPYKAADGSCAYRQDKVAVTLDNYKYCNDCTEDDWHRLLAQGPLAIAVDANDFGKYDSGIYEYTAKCGGINHAVTAVAYQVNPDGKGDVITIRNSWSDGWGEKGFMRIRVNNLDKTCHALNYGYLAVAKGGNPPPPPPPPPPVDECFTVPATPKMHPDWHLPAPFSGTFYFYATGINFNLGFHEGSSGAPAYFIQVAKDNEKTYIYKGDPNGSRSSVCIVNTNLNEDQEYLIGVDFNSSTATLKFWINYVNFPCKLSTAADVSKFNYMSFSNYNKNTGKAAKICRPGLYRPKN